MQPQPHPISSDRSTVDVSPAAALAVARAAWFRGDFNACLDALEALDPVCADDATRVEGVLVRARALQRLRRYTDVVELLDPLLPTFASVDEACTARLLHAASLSRSGQTERGLQLLADVATAAQALHAHRTIQAEIAHARALAHWLERDLDKTAALAAEAEAAGADVISVRAIQLLGFVALANQQYPEALEIFRRAYAAYQSCAQLDADLAEAIVVQIASLEVSLLSNRIRGTHPQPGAPDRRRTWAFGISPPTAPSLARMQIAELDAWLCIHDGDKDGALRLARQAQDLAPSTPWLVWALANRSSIVYACREPDSANEHAQHAFDLSRAIDWNATSGEERVALLLLVEALAVCDPPAAIATYGRYAALRTPMSANEIFSDDPRLRVLELVAHGIIRRLAGAPTGAREFLKQAHVLARRHGIVWREAMIWIELDATSTPDTPAGDHYLEPAAILVREHFPTSAYFQSRLGRWAQAYEDPIVSELTITQREVLRHLLDGLDTDAIAAVRGCSPNTIRNHTARLREAFAVDSNDKVVVACYRRGIDAAALAKPVITTLRPDADVARLATGA